MDTQVKQKILEELNDFAQRKGSNLSDALLIQSELQCVPYSKVKELYDRYVELNCMKLFLEETGLRYNRVQKYFTTYNLPLLGRTETSKKLSAESNPKLKMERMMDTLIMSQSEWNKKYGITSRGRYYKTKNRAKRLAE